MKTVVTGSSSLYTRLFSFGTETIGVPALPTRRIDSWIRWKVLDKSFRTAEFKGCSNLSLSLSIYLQLLDNYIYAFRSSTFFFDRCLLSRSRSNFLVVARKSSTAISSMRSRRGSDYKLRSHWFCIVEIYLVFLAFSSLRLFQLAR